MRTNLKPLIKNELRQSRKTLLVWLALLIMLCLFCYFEMLSLKDSLDEMAVRLNQFPPLLLILFGVRADITTPLGWYGCLYFWIGLLAFPYAIYLGISCLSREIKQGTAEYLFTKPVTRGAVVQAKAAASICNLLVFTTVSGLCMYFTIIAPMGGLSSTAAAIATIAGMFFTQLALFALGLFLASVIPTQKTATHAGVLLMLLFYGISIAAQYTGISWLDYLTPLRYFDVFHIALQGFRLSYLMLTALLLAGSIWIATKRWNKREL